jgi:UDP-galactopyranose mutase
MKYVIVGSGFFGVTMAERLASHGEEVLIIEKRSHIGGNSYTYFDEETGIEIHKYGSHLFHTSNEKVWEYCNRFTGFTNYKHTVWANHKNKIYSMPINMATMTAFFEKALSPNEAKELILKESQEIDSVRSLEDKAISLIGSSLYNAFIKGYTQKQWQTDPKKLPEEIITRLPVRYTFNNNYFNDKYEGLPVDGYTKWIERMVDHKNITILTNTDFFDIKDKFKDGYTIIYTGPIDRYFNYVYGELSWRTLDFELETHNVKDYQGASVINYSDIDIEFTRIHEFKHLHPERNYSTDKTVISKEYSRFANKNDEPYYPINSKEDRERLKKYRDLSKKEKNVIFGGRLGSYQYLDMHMAIASALSKFEEFYYE